MSLGNVLQKNKRFSADVQSIAQSYTTMKVMVTIQLVLEWILTKNPNLKILYLIVVCVWGGGALKPKQ